MPSDFPQPLVRELFEGPIDLVGDVHGEIDALEELLRRLGYPEQGPHPQGRRLVYVGDLVDRGPDSPAVVERVMAQVAEGQAQCLLGNHELNLLRSSEERPNRKHGNHWFWGESEPIGPDLPLFGSRAAQPDQRARFHTFFSQLPLALERRDLRVVHACWDASAIERARQRTDARILYQEADAATRAAVKESGLAARSRDLRQRYREALQDPTRRDLPFLPEVAEHHTRLQIENPVKVLSSGLEEPISPKARPYHIGGKWRMTMRVP